MGWGWVEWCWFIGLVGVCGYSVEGCVDQGGSEAGKEEGREKDGKGKGRDRKEEKGIEWFGDWVVRGGGVGSRVVWVLV